MNNNTLSIQKEISEIISLHEKGLFKEALKKTDALSNANPNNALIFNAYGIIYASLENFEKTTISPVIEKQLSDQLSQRSREFEYVS